MGLNADAERVGRGGMRESRSLYVEQIGPGSSVLAGAVSTTIRPSTRLMFVWYLATETAFGGFPSAGALMIKLDSRDEPARDLFGTDLAAALRPVNRKWHSVFTEYPNPGHVCACSCADPMKAPPHFCLAGGS